VTCHDGFTLADLVAYNRKHNIANGEDNRDGMSENLSWNCGVEGPTDDPKILELRRRQARNFLTVVLVSQGTPMLLGGDELGRSQGGNNNAYCQDNPTSWYDWTGLETNAGLHRFVKILIAFRKAHPVLRRRTFLTGRGTKEHPLPDVRWHGQRLNHPDWGRRSRMLAMHLAGVHAPEPDDDVYVAINGSSADRLFELPAPPTGCEWMRVIDTAQTSPDDAFEAGAEPAVDDANLLRVEHHACVVLCSRSR
jgi:glycogen operon protein